MTAPRFFVREGLAREMVGTTIELPPTVAHHATRVVRLGARDAITLFDGKGGEYAAEITALERRTAHARITAFAAVERESPLAITLVQAIVATDAMDYAVRKAVELGVHAIVPVIAQRSAPMPEGARAEKRVAHWNEIAIAACEQCGRNRVPSVASPVRLAAYAPRVAEQLLVCAFGAASIGSIEITDGRCAIVIGPEGGLTGDELTQLERSHAIRVGLGPRTLRTETAVCAALSILQAGSGDLR